MNKQFRDDHALFMPEYLGPSACEIGASSLFFKCIEFDLPIFLQAEEIISQFYEVGVASKKKYPLVETALGITAQLFKEMQFTTNQTLENLKPLFESKYFTGIGTIHFVLRGGREHIIENTRELIPLAKKLLVNPAIAHVAAKEMIWHIHELYLELEGNVPQILDYLDTDANKYHDPLDYIATFVLHRLPALEDNPEHVLTNSPFMIEALASIGNTVTVPDDRDTNDVNMEYLAFVFFDSIISPFMPTLDTSSSKKLVSLRTNRKQELAALQKHVREVATNLLNNACENIVTENAIEDSLYSTQTMIRETLAINKQAWKAYFQALLESKPIWLGLVGLITSITNGSFPLISAGLGAEIIASFGTNAAKVIRKRRQSLASNPVRFLYYLNRELHSIKVH